MGWFGWGRYWYGARGGGCDDRGIYPIRRRRKPPPSLGEQGRLPPPPSLAGYKERKDLSRSLRPSLTSLRHCHLAICLSCIFFFFLFLSCHLSIYLSILPDAAAAAVGRRRRRKKKKRCFFMDRSLLLLLLLPFASFASAATTSVRID